MEDHYAKYPEDRPGQEQNEDSDELQIITPATGNPSTVAGEANTASEIENTRRRRGRPRKDEVQGNTSSEGSVELTGALKRKRGRSPTRKVDKTPPTVKDELSSECIGEKMKRKKKPGKQLLSPFKALEPSKPC